MIVVFIFSIVFAYLIGSIPFGLILTKVFLKQDVRDIGSGNTGATNVLRTGHKSLAVITLLLDAIKGMIIIFYYISMPRLGAWYDGHEEYVSSYYILFLLVGFFAILGHCFPIWLKFKGGKGVATALGVLVAAVPITGFVAILVWILSFLAGRISSLAALSAMLVAPVVTLAVYGTAPAVVNAMISLLVFVRHKDNIKRLMKGEEPQFKSK